MSSVILAALSALVAVPALAEEQPRVGLAPAWVTQAAAPQQASQSGDTPLRVLLQDQQIWFHGGVTSLYQHRILRVDRPEGLQAMQRLSVQWRPDSDRLTIHTFRLTRGARANDLLSAVQEVLAHRSINYGGLRMDGQRSLGLPIAGMQVGDIVEIAYSIDRSEPLLGGHHELSLDAGTRGGIDRLMLAASWDGDVAMSVAGRNLPAPLAQMPGRVQLVTDAPLGESKAARSIEFSDFRQWGDVAALFVPLFAEARRSIDGSPIRAEALRIAAATPEPARRVGLALETVREKVKYLYVGLGEGNLRPMPADMVWQRGFGDCKGKTALLLAMLDALGIKAEAALVATRGGDGLDRRLPALGGFDHVIVRAQLDGRVVWLDPTLEGEGASPRFGWALPVHPGAALEPMGTVLTVARLNKVTRSP